MLSECVPFFVNDPSQMCFESLSKANDSRARFLSVP